MTASRDRLAVLFMGGDWQAVVARMREFDRNRFRVNLREPPLTATPRVAVMTTGESLVAMALATSRGRSGDLDTAVLASNVHVLEQPIPIDAIDALMPGRVAVQAGETLRGGGLLTPRAAAELAAALGELSSEASETLGQLQRLQQAPRLQPTELGQLLEEQRDALALGLEIAGLDSLVLLPSVDEDPEPVPFLTRLAEAPTTEASLIRHDFQNFGDWEIAEGVVHDTLRFVDPNDDRRRVTVFYADKEPLEQLTGTDLIYYREDRAGFVLVQYKRMAFDDRAPQGEGWGYRPDEQLDIEIGRMRAFTAQASAVSVDDWRLSSQAFYVKLVEGRKARPAGRRLTSGMYFPLDLFELVRASASTEGPRGGRRIGWHNAGRYLTNTQFLELLQHGLIGSSAAATARLTEAISTTLESGRGAVIVRDETEAEVDRRRRA